jgi:AcrR family transcriptional regulator
MSKGEQTRQMIIEQSAPIFNTKGIAATAMSDIMEATNLSKGSLYVHFDNKEVLAAEVVDYNLEMLHQKTLAAVKRVDHPKEKLFAYLDMYRNALKPPVEGGCPMLNFGMEADDQDEMIRKKVALMVNGAQQMIEDIIVDGIRRGVFRPDWDYKEFATIMFAMIEGGILISRTTRSTDKTGVINRYLKNIIEGQTV